MDGQTDAKWLIGPAEVGSDFRNRVNTAYRQLATRESPVDYHAWVGREFDIDLSTEYAGIRIENPWGKASGQLSMTPQQVSEDVLAGLGYVVLKTVIAESEDGGQSMAALNGKSRTRFGNTEAIVDHGGVGVVRHEPKAVGAKRA